LRDYSAHLNNLDMLEFAETNQVILLWLLSYTTHALQPQNLSILKPLKYYFEKARHWMVLQNDRKITRILVETLNVKEPGRKLYHCSSDLLDLEQEGYTYLTQILIRITFSFLHKVRNKIMSLSKL
jgi:hypothetical protein